MVGNCTSIQENAAAADDDGNDIPIRGISG